VAYSASGYDNDAEELNAKIEMAREGKDEIRNPKITKHFMKNFDHNAKLLAESRVVGILSYNNRNSIKPADIVEETLGYEMECNEKESPVTLAGLCHKLRVSRTRLIEMLGQK
jgi:hypothetical protein